MDFPRVFRGFRCPGPAWSYLGPTWPPRRLQEPLERVPRLPRRLQESLRRLQRPPRHPQEPPRCSQDTSPRSPKIENFIMLFNLLAFLGLLGGSSLNMVVKTLPRCLRASKVCLRPSRPLPKSASKSLLLRPRPFTKGGLAVVRPRRPSSIRQTTLVSHGRVQDRKSS